MAAPPGVRWRYFCLFFLALYQLFRLHDTPKISHKHASLRDQAESFQGSMGVEGKGAGSKGVGAGEQGWEQGAKGVGAGSKGVGAGRLDPPSSPQSKKAYFIFYFIIFLNNNTLFN